MKLLNTTFALFTSVCSCFADTREAVDLALPSGLKWASCNVGADKPEDWGDCFAWGEISTKSEYTESNSMTQKKSIADLQKDGIVGNDSIVSVSYDPAATLWGDGWRMPTRQDYEELIANCKWTWCGMEDDGYYRVKGNNGNFIYLPASGACLDDNPHFGGNFGQYWTSSADGGVDEEGNCFTWYLAFDFEKFYLHNLTRSIGRAVRPVKK